MNEPNKGSKNISAQLPLAGDTTCGLFGISEDYEEAYLSLDQHFVPNREATYFLKATGDSMRPLIIPGDILIVDRSKRVHSGQIIIATYNGQRLCKRFMQEHGRVWLQSENPKHKPIPIDPEVEFVVFGPVIGMARFL